MIKYKVTFRKKCGYTKNGIYRNQSKSFTTSEERNDFAEKIKNNRYYEFISISDEEPKIEKPITTTCQICGRVIKANTGTIAHHGYQRPYEGFQTSSCYGAKYPPYEESRDRIPYVIDRLETSIQNSIEFINQIKNKEIALHYLKIKYVHHRKEQELIKVEIDNPEYNKIAESKIFEKEMEIKHMQRDKKRLEERYKNWEKQ